MLLLQILLSLVCATNISTQDGLEDEIQRMMHHYELMAEGASLYATYAYSGVFGSPSPAKDIYDFIIIGSGSAGSVLANRLSEIERWNVLLLEVGDEPQFFTDIPALAVALEFTNYNWGFLMEKQENIALGLVDQRMNCPRGRALGGSTIINFMIGVRGNRFDYDRWALMGNPGWSYDDVLPYFLKLEDSSVRNQDEDFHRRGGYLNIQDIPYRTQSAHAYVNATLESGYRYVDYNGETQLGTSYIQATLRNGMRCSVEKAYLRPVRHRPNLTVLTKSRVTRILINPETRHAYGVEYIRNKRNLVATASKEVILSAGAINSPQLLMLSGIGPKDHLQELKIPVLQDLPVGQKLYDHITFTGLSFVVDEPIVLPLNVGDDPKNYLQYFFSGSGPQTSPIGAEAITFLKSNISNHIDDYPDLEFLFVSTDFHVDRGRIIRRSFRISDEIYNRVWKPLEGQYLLKILPVLLHPNSFGYLRLKSRNPFHWPRLYGNHLTDPEDVDLKTMLHAIREAERIATTPSFRKIGAKLVTTPIPGCENHVFDSDPYWTCALRHIASPIYHPMTTCKMGPPNDPEAVVDSRLRVYGIKRLRVVDASVIPVTISGHLNVPTIMVAEKASDLIKEDWLKDESSVIDPIYIKRDIPKNKFMDLET